MNVAKTPILGTTAKPRVSRIQAEIALVRQPEKLSADEAAVRAETLRRELESTGVCVVRVRHAVNFEGTIFAIHFVKKADAKRMAEQVQNARPSSLFAA